MRRSLPDSEIARGQIDAHRLVADDVVRSQKDAHVAACAMSVRIDCPGHCPVILTTKNLKDFRAMRLKERGIDLMHPDRFLSMLFAQNVIRVAAAFREFRESLKSGDGASAVLARLAKDGQVMTAMMLAAAADAGDITL